MGLSSFNRMRRSRLPAEEIETERFKKDNKARWDAHHARSHTGKEYDKDLERVEKAEVKAREEIGRKAEQGMKEAAEGGIPDLPLRKDHAAEITGRTLQHDPQGKPLDPIERLHERIPPGTTANEKLAEAIGNVDQDGPTIKQVMAVEQEMLTPEEREMRNPPAKTVAGAAAKATEGAEPRKADDGAGANAEAAKADAKTAEAAKTAEDRKDAEKTPAQKREDDSAARKAAEEKLPAAGPAPDVGSKDGSKSEPVRTTSKK